MPQYWQPEETIHNSNQSFQLYFLLMVALAKYYGYGKVGGLMSDMTQMTRIRQLDQVLYDGTQREELE